MQTLSAAGQVAHRLESVLSAAGRKSLAVPASEGDTCYFGDPLGPVLQMASPRCIGEPKAKQTEAAAMMWKGSKLELWQALSTPPFKARARGIAAPSLLQILGNRPTPLEQSRRSQWVFLLYLHWSMSMQERHAHFAGVVFNRSTEWEPEKTGNTRGRSMGPTHWVWKGYLSMMQSLCLRYGIAQDVDLPGLAAFERRGAEGAEGAAASRRPGTILRVSCPEGPGWIDTLARWASRSSSTHLDSAKLLLGRRYRSPAPGERLETDWRWDAPAASPPITFRVAENRTPLSLVKMLFTALELDRRLTQERGMDFFGPQGTPNPLQSEPDTAGLPHAVRMQALDRLLLLRAGGGAQRPNADRPRFLPFPLGSGDPATALDLVIEPIELALDWHAQSFDARVPWRFCLLVNLVRFRSLIGDPDYGWLLDIDVHAKGQQWRTYAVCCGWTEMPASSPLERPALLSFEVQYIDGIPWLDHTPGDAERLRLEQAKALAGVERVTGERLLHLRLDLASR